MQLCVDGSNTIIVGRIEVIEAYAGPKFNGVIDPVSKLPTAIRE